MRDAPGKSFGAIIFFVLCIILITRDSTASRKEDKGMMLLGHRYYALEEGCPYREGEILERVGEVEEELKRVQKDIREYKRKRKDENI